MKLAIIDGDVLCYQACKSRWESKVKIEDDTMFIELNEDGSRKELEFTQEENRAYLEESWDNLRKDLINMVDGLYCDDYLMAVKGEGNFRNDLYPEYKLNRKQDPSKQNIFVPVLRKLAVYEDYAVAADGMEADDLIRIWSEEAKKAGIEYVICSIDKDLRCIPGRHYYMKRGGERIFDVSEEEALRHYYEQLLKGDPTDNIPGIPRVGPVKAEKMLAPYNLEEDYQVVVVEQYMNAYNDDWYEALLMNGRMIHLLRHPGDYFNPSIWDVVKELKGVNKNEI